MTASDRPLSVPQSSPPSAPGSAGPPPISPAFLAIGVGRVLRTEIETELARVGLSLRHLSALGHLAGQPGLSYSELARRGGITVQSMQSTLRQLEAMNAVQRLTPPRPRTHGRPAHHPHRRSPPHARSTGHHPGGPAPPPRPAARAAPNIHRRATASIHGRHQTRRALRTPSGRDTTAFLCPPDPWDRQAASIVRNRAMNVISWHPCRAGRKRETAVTRTRRCPVPSGGRRGRVSRLRKGILGRVARDEADGRKLEAPTAPATGRRLGWGAGRVPSS